MVRKLSLKRRTFKKSLKRYKRTKGYKRTKKNTLKRRVSRKTLRRKNIKGGRPRATTLGPPVKFHALNTPHSSKQQQHQQTVTALIESIQLSELTNERTREKRDLLALRGKVNGFLEKQKRGQNIDDEQELARGVEMLKKYYNYNSSMRQFEGQKPVAWSAEPLPAPAEPLPARAPPLPARAPPQRPVAARGVDEAPGAEPLPQRPPAQRPPQRSPAAPKHSTDTTATAPQRLAAGPDDKNQGILRSLFNIEEITQIPTGKTTEKLYINRIFDTEREISKKTRNDYISVLIEVYKKNTTTYKILFPYITTISNINNFQKCGWWNRRGKSTTEDECRKLRLTSLIDKELNDKEGNVLKLALTLFTSYFKEAKVSLH
jgi:hypothetical protein